MARICTLCRIPKRRCRWYCFASHKVYGPTNGVMHRFYFCDVCAELMARRGVVHGRPRMGRLNHL